MFADRDFNGLDARYPQPFTSPSNEFIADINDRQSLPSQLYAAAWTLAQRDYELDRLFNADFYQAGDK
jgi:hypothetical protein